MQKSSLVDKYRLDALAGDSSAQYNLGIAYYEGLLEVKQDFNQALYWITQSAKQGNSAAQCSLGIFYKDGIGTEIDYKAAQYWLQNASDSGDEGAKAILSEMVKHGLIAPTANQEAQSNKDLFNDYLKKAQAGDISAKYNLALIFYEGLFGITPNRTKAFCWMHSAAEDGDVDAQFNLGLFYKKGIGTKKDDKLAAKWIESAALKDDTDAICLLAQLYCEGDGVEKDIKQAYRLYTLAAQHGSKEAVANISIIENGHFGSLVDFSQTITKENTANMYS